MKHKLIQLEPADEYNRALEANVRPPLWANPQPKGRYHLVVIGAGTAGLVTAAGAAGLGARVALIERELMGGDCLNVGCVPSKGVISAARVAANARDAAAFGVSATGSRDVDFGQAMMRMRRLRAKISPNDSAQRFTNLGVDVYFGQGSFVDRQTIRVTRHDDSVRDLKFSRAVIATGARAAAPPISGLNSVRYLTNESVFSLTELPKRFGIIGSGPIGSEMAQAFARLGSQVYLFERSGRILPREDEDASTIVKERLLRDGVHVLLQSKDFQVESIDDQLIRVRVNREGKAEEYIVDSLLVAVGRAPNCEGLNLEAVDVRHGPQGVEVDDHLRTSNPRIFAAGDVCSRYKFTHAADFQARIVIQNALLAIGPLGRRKASRLIVPWATYTSPEVAHVGLHASDAQAAGVAFDTYIQHFSDVDRAILDGQDEGFVKVLTKAGSDRILGATIVAEHAGDLISEITLAMNHGIGLSGIGGTIHPYPTQAEAIRKLGDQFNRTRLTPLVKSLFRKRLSWI